MKAIGLFFGVLATLWLIFAEPPSVAELRRIQAKYPPIEQGQFKLDVIK